MKRLLLILILTLSFQSWTMANDFKEFQIEGMSIGDSALDFFDKSILENGKELNWYDTKIFTPIRDIELDNAKTYVSFQLAVKSDDNNYIIESVAGFVYYKNNINKCYQKLDDIGLEIKKLFKNIKSKKRNYKHSGDKSGKSTIRDIIFLDNRKNQITIACYDWSKKMKYWDQLRISIATKEYRDWIKIAYD